MTAERNSATARPCKLEIEQFAKIGKQEIAAVSRFVFHAEPPGRPRSTNAVKSIDKKGKTVCRVLGPRKAVTAHLSDPFLEHFA